MINHQALQLAIRAHLASLSVVTTGSTTLGIAGGVFTRTTGSFLTDGFKTGMEVTPTGFAATTKRVVTDVAALTLTVNATLSDDTASAGRTLSVGLPTGFASENIEFQPVAGAPWFAEELLSGPVEQITLGALGWIEHDPLYVLQIHVAENTGVGAANAYADAVITHFAPRTDITLSNGDVARVRVRPGPFRGQLRNFRTGYATITVSVPLRIHTINSI